MGHRRSVVYSDSSDEETQEVAPARPSHGAKERASEAWQPLIPISRAQSQHAQSDPSDKQSADDPGKSRPKSKSKSKEEIESGRDNYAAPDINFNASDDERARRAAARKNSQEQTPTPALQSHSSKRAAHKEQRNEESESSSSSDSDNDKSSGDEDNAENTEHSDLEELEKDPRALEAQFEAEAANWADDDDDEHQDPPQRSQSGNPHRDKRHSHSESARAHSHSASHEDKVSSNKKRAKLVQTSKSDASDDDDIRVHHTAKKRRSSSERLDDGKTRSSDKNPNRIAGDDGGSRDKPRGGDRTVDSERKVRQDNRENSRNVYGGPDKKQPGGKGTAMAAAQKTHGEAHKSGQKHKKAREDINWAHPSEDNCHEPPRKLKRSQKHRKAKGGDGGNSDSSSSESGSDESELGSDSDDSDSDGIELVLRKHGSRLKLKKQRPRVRRIAKQAIEDMLINVCTVNAYPNGPDKTNEFAQSSLRRSVKALGDMDIARRLKHNDKYWKKLATIPLQRVPNFRGKIKKVTDTLVKRAYGLKQGDALKVIWLQEGLWYIFPFDYETSELRVPDCVAHFRSSLAEAPHEKEIPAAMLTLVAMAIYASIDDYRNVCFEAGNFKSNLFIDIYRQNIAALSEFKTEKPGKYHRFMQGLFKEVCTWTGAGAPHSQVKSFLNTKGMTDD
ncbi:hypothetical protein OH76DRAFT_1418297 [Lentinus brumalis]|uniref:DUF6532 domain-containing protein n=1 Tax=Lentinus brumalis TaxID=2498619 RepID=A0A371DBB5_9APHY|nr:hypothetical protein OH76DRAFT_1418297 [Polyporus brumalis]